MCASSFTLIAQYYASLHCDLSLCFDAFLSLLIISAFCCLVPYFPVGFHGNDNKKYPGSV